LERFRREIGLGDVHIRGEMPRPRYVLPPDIELTPCSPNKEGEFVPLDNSKKDWGFLQK
jgi:hypothetical protein